MAACKYPKKGEKYTVSPVMPYTSPSGKLPQLRLLLRRITVPEFQPFVPASENPREFTLRAVLLGSFFGIVFGAVTVYVGLRAGLTVAASIPIAVISSSLRPSARSFFRSPLR